MKIKTFNTFDSSKPSVAFFGEKINTEHLHIFGFLQVLKSHFKKSGYNVVTIGNESSFEYDDMYVEFSPADMRKLNESYLRKVDDPNHYVINSKILQDFFATLDLSLLPDFEYFFCKTATPSTLPFIPYISKKVSEELHETYNEFHDYIGNDSQIEHILNAFSDVLVSNWDSKISQIAISTHKCNFFYNIINYLKPKFKHIFIFVIDPTVFYAFFDKWDKKTTHLCYFTNDDRGTRKKLKKFPIAELQHLVYDQRYKQDLFDEPFSLDKTRDLVFYGSIFHEKGVRSTLYEKFLKDINVGNNDFFIPLRKNGIISTTNNASKIASFESVVADTFTDLYNKIINNKYWRGYVIPPQLDKAIVPFKYSFVMRCISHNDSINYKIIKDLSLNIIPFLDDQYDPTFKYIPEKFQKKLTATNGNEINKKIKYFNDHEDEAMSLLKELQNYFKISQTDETYWINKFFEGIE